MRTFRRLIRKLLIHTLILSLSLEGYSNIIKSPLSAVPDKAGGLPQFLGKTCLLVSDSNGWYESRESLVNTIYYFQKAAL